MSSKASLGEGWTLSMTSFQCRWANEFKSQPRGSRDVVNDQFSTQVQWDGGSLCTSLFQHLREVGTNLAGGAQRELEVVAGEGEGEG